jgi:hypothetical protein
MRHLLAAQVREVACSTLSAGAGAPERMSIEDEVSDAPKDSPAGPADPSPSTRPRPSCAPATAPGAYIALSLGTGIRTEEARALLWDHVDFGDPSATPPRPASVLVWRSVRAHGDTNTPPRPPGLRRSA